MSRLYSSIGLDFGAEAKAVVPWTKEQFEDANIHAVYVAGPITPRGRVRFGLVKYALSENAKDMDTNAIPFSIPVDWPPSVLRFVYTGPFTGGCDHRCSHKYPHAPVEGTCANTVEAVADENLLQKTFDRAKFGIDVAKSVVARINREGCHGTIAEIGYAHGQEKPIYLSYATVELAREHWFVSMMADRVFVMTDDNNAVIRSLLQSAGVEVADTPILMKEGPVKPMVSALPA